MKSILVLMLINLFYFNVQGATCIFDTLSLKDSFVKFEYRVSGGVALFSPNHLDQIIIYPSGQSFGFVQFNNPNHSIMDESQGFVLRNSLVLKLKNRLISPCVDIAFAHGNFNMIQYDEYGNQINLSWFKNINLLTLSPGFKISGKYLEGGVQYSIGYCGGGDNNESLPFIPDLVKNNKLNLISNIYQGIDISLCVKYNNFNLTYRRGFPITNPIHINGILYGGLWTMSLELGYTLKIFGN